MVTGGITSSDKPLPLVEVFPGGFFQDRDLSANYRYSCPSLPVSRYGHAQAGLEVCGGGGQDEATSTNCQTFANGRWSTCHALLRPRTNHTSWSSRAGVVLLGGSASPNTTELLEDYSFQVRGRLQNGSINIFKGQFYSYSDIKHENV